MTTVEAPPVGEMITDLQVEEHINRFSMTIRELSRDEYNAVREDEDYKNLARQLDGKIQRIVNRRFPLGASLPLNSLNGLRHTEANTSLFYDWSNRDSEEERYERLKAYCGTHLGISSFELTPTGPQDVPGWQQILVISPVDLAVYLRSDIVGTKSQHAKAYCDLARPLVTEIIGLQKSDYIRNDCLGKDGARLEANTARQWQSLSDPQQPGLPLKVRRMSVNPATWFGYDGTQYSVAPINVRLLANHLTVGSKVRSAACGDLITLASLLVGEPQISDQIALGTCPRIDVPGTELRGGLGWSHCPRVFRNEGVAWLCGVYAADAYGGFFGSLLCVVE